MTRIPLSDVHFALGQYIPGLGSFTNLTSIRASMWLLPDTGVVEVTAALPDAEPHWFPIHTVTKMTPAPMVAVIDEPVSTGDAGGSPKREGKKKPAAGTKG